jgi:hypothetical protein
MEKLTELKAQAYDAMAALEFWQKKLIEINKQIEELLKNENNQSN